jgi:Heparinase II/III-like protein/Heparinase II/III N-terminus
MLYATGIALVFAIIWVPWFSHNHVPNARLTSAMIERARSMPQDAVLVELAKYDIGLTAQWKDDVQLLEVAEKLVRGRVDLPGFPVGSITFPLEPKEMASGPTMWQLFIHSLGLPRVLLNAYKKDRRVQFLHAAAVYLLAYDTFEGSGWSLGGYLWNDNLSRFVRNDHAVAARVYVLAEFWRLYRHSSDYSPDVAKAVFRMAARCAYLLANPSRFTFATNHGIMQNLATCHLRLSFPMLPDIERSCQLAFERLDDQLHYFINDEGFVLEHSPGYQAFALLLLHIAFEYRSLLALPVPTSWTTKYEAAQKVYALLRRPDGSLPTFGDTDGASYGAEQLYVFDDQRRIGSANEQPQVSGGALFVAAVAGYYVSQDGFTSSPDPNRYSHTAITWSYFPGMGHKHADEMSLALWARGTSWWGNVGYWPYDDPDRNAAESWEGSNAPHLVGEPSESSRETYLRYHGRKDHLTVIDIERVGPGSYRARRQVIRIRDNIWVVVDSSRGVERRRTRTVWNTTPGVQLIKSGVKGTYKLVDPSSGRWMHVYINGSPGTEQIGIRGSRRPFGGWSVVNGTVEPAPGIVVERPVDGLWTLSLWSFGDEPNTELEITAPPRMSRWFGVEDWEMILPNRDGQLTLRRFHDRFDVSSATSESLWSLDSQLGPDVKQAKINIHAAFASSAAKYRVADMSGNYRGKVTVLLIGLLGLSMGASFLCRRYRPVWKSIVTFVLAAGWLLVSYYFVFVRAQLV